MQQTKNIYLVSFHVFENTKNLISHMKYFVIMPREKIDFLKKYMNKQKLVY